MPGSDFNGDGRDDILWRNRDSGAVGTWLATDSGGFGDNSANSLIGVPSQWHIAATGDLDEDGHDDILWYNSATHQIGSWLGQDNGGFVVQAGLTGIGNAIVLGVGDFNDNGTDDVLLLRTGGSTGRYFDVLLSYGTGFLEIEFLPFRAIPADWNFAGIGDFNGDGNDDVLWRQDNGTIVMRLAHPGFGVGGRGFMSNDAASVPVPNDWQISGVGDFNGDGFDDLLWRHESGAVGNWLGGNGGLFAINQASVVGVPLDWLIEAVGDYNGDGRDDILWRNANGALGTWLGTDTGVFSVNPEPLVVVATNWLVQPNASGAGEWDY